MPKRQMMLTKKILKDTPELGYGDNKPMEELTVTAKFFDPTGSFTWYLMELDKDENRAYGFVTSHMVPDGEFGPFSINELRDLDLPFGLYIERDKFFKPMNLKVLYDKVQKGIHV
tara:strand:- start:1177 stop:1521 length:345 start_codon:yes stop_codon:yes gene_type:complete